MPTYLSLDYRNTQYEYVEGYYYKKIIMYKYLHKSLKKNIRDELPNFVYQKNYPL